MGDQSPSDGGNASELAPLGPFQYYQPPPSLQADNRDQTFRDDPTIHASTSPEGHAGGSRIPIPIQQHGSQRPKSGMEDRMPDAVKRALAQQPYTTSAQLAQTVHVNSTDLPGSSQQAPLHNVDLDDSPANLRSNAWSPIPEPTHDIQHAEQSRSSKPFPERQKSQKTSNPSDATGLIRRSSVPDRSPLQNLESDSKEKRRAMVEEAEDVARRKSIVARGEGEILRSGTLRGDKRKPVRSEDTQEPSGRGRRDRASDSADYATQRQDVTDELRTSEPLSKNARNKEKSKRDNERTSSNSQPAPPSKHQTESLDSSRAPTTKHIARSLETHEPEWNAAAAERGKAIHERRRSNKPSSMPNSPGMPPSPQTASSGRAGGRSDQPWPPRDSLVSNHTVEAGPGSAHSTSYQSSNQSTSRGPQPATKDDDATTDVHNIQQARKQTRHSSVKYTVPPQVKNAQQAREQVGFDQKGADMQAVPPQKHPRFHPFVHDNEQNIRNYRPTRKPLEFWKKADTARLTLRDVNYEETLRAAASTAAAAIDPPASKEDASAAWWEKDDPADTPKRETSKRERKVPDLSRYQGPYEEKAFGFQPRLYLKCGPLLRFTGIRTDRDVETWHGSIMIVTPDDQSEGSSAPVLRIFAQPMDLLPPPSKHFPPNTQGYSAEQDDPIAGQVKLSRTGRALYVRSVHEIDRNVDLSRLENPKGLFSATRTPLLGPQEPNQTSSRPEMHVKFQNKSRIKNGDGEKAGRYREVKAIRLHEEHGHTFWRFNVAVELGSTQARIAYRINKGPAIAFWVPAKGETMNIMFHSCNGFSTSVNPNDFSGPDPLWRDVLNRHQHRPFHVMIGGGDQIYNDCVSQETHLFGEWVKMKNPEHKRKAEFSYAMQDELEEFYFNRYAMWFSQGLFGMANSQIPMINIWDDHDIIDGYGSYPHSFMSTPVFTGIGAVAFKYYMLFQHQSLVAETEEEEPSWLLGESPGPYINELSRSVYINLGKHVGFLGVDCRTERMKDEVLSQETYDVILARCRKEIVKGSTKHLIVLLGVPIAYPRLNFLENILTSRAMDPIKAIGRTGMLGGFVNKFDGGVEILDDLDDHWTAKHHKAERNWFIQSLQDIAAEKSVRITILGGDVHLGAIGQFYTAKKFAISKDKDHRYMPNIISSAIVNTPPPTMMADVLNRRNKIHHLDDETDEDMIPMFTHDVDGTRRNNKHLLPRRNYCTIKEFIPGHTPPSSPKLGPSQRNPAFATSTGEVFGNNQERKFPPGSMKRTMSLTRGTATLVRRLSGSRNRKPSVALQPDQIVPYEQTPKPLQRANSISGPHPESSAGSQLERPINQFHRRPTNLSIKEARRAAAKGGADGDEEGAASGHVNLEGGLDISICMEIDQHDPAGTTEPYRLLVPSLFYEDIADPNINRFSSHRKSLMDRLRNFRRREEPIDQESYDADDPSYDDHDDFSSRSGSPVTPTEPHAEPNPTFQSANPRQDSVTSPNAAATDMGLTKTGRGAQNTASRSDASHADFGPRLDSNFGSLRDGPARNAGTSLSQQSSANPQPGHRRSSAPAPVQRPSAAVARQAYANDGYTDDGALTSDDDDVDDIDPQPRTTTTTTTVPNNRLFPPIRQTSKVDRFFGGDNRPDTSPADAYYLSSGPSDSSAQNTGLWGTTPGTTNTWANVSSIPRRGASFSARKMSMQLDSRPNWGSLTREGSTRKGKLPGWMIWKS